MKQFKLPDTISPFKIATLLSDGRLQLDSVDMAGHDHRRIIFDSEIFSIFAPQFTGMYDYDNCDGTIRINPLSVRSVNIENNLGMNFGQIRMELVFSAGGDPEYTNIINILEKHLK